MKLPENKKERIQLFVLIGVVTVTLLYFGITWAARPMLQKGTERRQQIATLKAELTTAARVIEYADQSRAANRETVLELRRIAETNAWVLKDRLGNYELEARELIEERALAAGVPVRSVREVGISDPPAEEKERTPGAFRLYTARVQVEGGIHALSRLLLEMEQSNPYLCISAIGIVARPASPAAHDMTFDVQWPIWRDAGALEQITEEAGIN